MWQHWISLNATKRNVFIVCVSVTCLGGALCGPSRWLVLEVQTTRILPRIRLPHYTAHIGQGHRLTLLSMKLQNGLHSINSVSRDFRYIWSLWIMLFKIWFWNDDLYVITSEDDLYLIISNIVSLWLQWIGKMNVLHLFPPKKYKPDLKVMPYLFIHFLLCLVLCEISLHVCLCAFRAGVSTISLPAVLTIHCEHVCLIEFLHTQIHVH